jgi:hypothetical protein
VTALLKQLELDEKARVKKSNSEFKGFLSSKTAASPTKADSPAKATSPSKVEPNGKAESVDAKGYARSSLRKGLIPLAAKARRDVEVKATYVQL